MTAQFHESLIYEGEKTSMAFCPPIPDNNPRIIELTDKEIKDQDEFSAMFILSTACWREYIGTWEIKDGCFYLVGLEGKYRLSGDEPLFADWFTGVLSIPRGQMIQCVHMDFDSVFEEEIHIKIEQGIVTNTRVVDNRKKKHDKGSLGWENLPGMENLFFGDEDI